MLVENVYIKQLFEKWAIEDIKSITPLPRSGSARKYYRIQSETKTAIAAYNPEEKENLAFVTFSRYFKRFNLNVPEVYAHDITKHIYILEDLGNLNLYDLLNSIRIDKEFPKEAVLLYKKVLEHLPRFQIVAGNLFDYSACYPRQSFDKQSMMWDLNYFKYYFLKLAKVSFDEQRLEDDFNKLADFLLQAENNYFMYRDFQSRNIMIYKGDSYFIDFQGGRKGPLQYDVASLLFDAKADIPVQIRTELIDHYLNATQQYTKISRDSFFRHFYGFVLIRIFQAMGAYGYRGYYEKKEHFLTSIPFAVKNLEWIKDNKLLNIDLPELKKVIDQIVYTTELKRYEWQKNEDEKMRLRIFSFSYFDRMPEDLSGNGGGFVFDCRVLHNPGRYDEYRELNGMDREVKLFLNNDPNSQAFLKHVYEMIDETVLSYLARGYTELMVSFGCTGGQHRSVYAAEQLAYHIQKKYRINIELNHLKLKVHKKLGPTEIL